MPAVLPAQSPPPTVAEPAIPNFLERILLHNIAWDTYESLLADLAEEHVFLTYDQGNLELMSPLPKHDKAGVLLARLIFAYTEIRNIPISSFARTTWRRRGLAKGLEADESFYVKNEPAVRGRTDIDLQKDPPPDLAIEVDITRNTLKKEEIYAALGITELWRFDDEKLVIRQLTPERRYVQTDVSPSLADLPAAEIQRFMDLRHTMSETAWILSFRQWVQDHFPTQDRTQ